MSLVEGWQGLYETHADDGLTVLNILWEDTIGNPPEANDLDAWVTTFSLTFPVLADPELEWYNRYITPTGEQFGTILVDRDGIIVWKEEGESAETLQLATTEVEAQL